MVSKLECPTNFETVVIGTPFLMRFVQNVWRQLSKRLDNCRYQNLYNIQTFYNNPVIMVVVVNKGLDIILPFQVC